MHNAQSSFYSWELLRLWEVDWVSMLIRFHVDLQKKKKKEIWNKIVIKLCDPEVFKVLTRSASCSSKPTAVAVSSICMLIRKYIVFVAQFKCCHTSLSRWFDLSPFHAMWRHAKTSTPLLVTFFNVPFEIFVAFVHVAFKCRLVFYLFIYFILHRHRPKKNI